MKKELAIAASLMSLCLTPAFAEGEKRELGAHEHGHSALNIAIEGEAIAMELIAPGADIVGFEHAAASEEDLAAVEQAEVKLGDPLSLFAFSSDAGCSVESAAVEIEGEEHHDEHADEAHAEEEHHDEHADEAHAEEEHHDEHADETHAEDEHHDDHEGEASHNEFHATYVLSCSAPDALDGIDFAAFFDSFAGAQEIDVTVISEKGQASYEVERDAATLDLQGLM